MKQRRLFCEISPLCYQISLRKEWLLRDLRDLFSGARFAKKHSADSLEHIIKSHRSPVLRQLAGVEMQLQRNKAANLSLAGERIDGLLIRPGESFSFWRTVGRTTAKKGYLDALVIFSGGRLGAGVGGGLCQLANLINWMALNSPMTITELHHHTDALFPDAQRRVPFGTGTSIFYKNLDYRFRNDTDQTVQLRIWLSDGDLCGELRSQRPFETRYRITERNSGFVCEQGVWYRVGKVYAQTLDKNGGLLKERLVLDNHSHVMYDPALIPPEQILERANAN